MKPKALSLLCIGCMTIGMASHATPIDPQATKETKALYANLEKIIHKGIMFGHQDDALYGVGWKYDWNRSDIKSVCGDYPAVFGWELGHLELGHAYSLDSVNFDTIRSRIREVYRRGAVNTISWHLNNPLGGTAWNAKTTTAVESILPGGAKNAMFNKWLTRLATFLLSLRDDHGKLIPVMFRPFHELTGGWFWWGAKQCTPKQYIELWRYTVHFLEEKGVHNLLYIYSPATVADEKSYFERYPGDKYVDILGVDIYQDKGENASERFIAETRHDLTFMAKTAKERHKIAVLSETGLYNVYMNDWWTNVLWKAIKNIPIAYVLVWRNACSGPPQYFAPYPGQESAKDFQLFKSNPKMIFENELPPMYR
ncbi:glycoside hydrolase family 26 protein [Microbacter margulisiae]|uniref:Mannan endo-1,4-beta-mannosidase n=1 Tax=Microbacter margulisiae TaxID=1350067 RepID=A0A7W5DU31_9PORP|nr:glycosyl hydrolase [Microbacter margulisiae]MBB3188723.1 hypothetical protein [Microbacter margulisiae]